MKKKQEVEGEDGPSLKAVKKRCLKVRGTQEEGKKD